MTDPITKTIIVNCAATDAFAVFVKNTSAWWPLDGHAASASQGKAALAVTIEPRLGGAIYETMFDGARDDWGEVLEYSEGKHFAMSWHPGNNKDCPTRLNVTFADTDDGKCLVTLVHSGWEAWGKDADDMRDGYDKGWDNVFGNHYAGGCTGLVT